MSPHCGTVLYIKPKAFFLLLYLIVPELAVGLLYFNVADWNDLCDHTFRASKSILSPSKAEQSTQDFGEGAFQLLGAIESLGERFGVTVPILFLRGSVSEVLLSYYTASTIKQH